MNFKHRIAKRRDIYDGFGSPRDWMDRGQDEGHEFLHEAAQGKNIWVPLGE